MYLLHFCVPWTSVFSVPVGNVTYFYDLWLFPAELPYSGCLWPATPKYVWALFCWFVYYWTFFSVVSQMSKFFCFLPLLQSQMRWGMSQRVLDGGRAALNMCYWQTNRALMTKTATFSMQEVNTLGLSVNAQDACSLQGIRRQKSVLHVSQSLLSQHLQKDSKQHFSPLTFLYGRCRGLLCIRDFSWVGQRSMCCT